VWSQTVIADAGGKLKAAKEADAEKTASYEYYAAQEYLHEARQKESHSQFERAITYGKKALDFATRALEKAKQEKEIYQPQQFVPYVKPGEQAPQVENPTAPAPLEDGTRK
jgi:hypothetical protein